LPAATTAACPVGGSTFVAVPRATYGPTKPLSGFLTHRLGGLFRWLLIVVPTLTRDPTVPSKIHDGQPLTAVVCVRVVGACRLVASASRAPRRPRSTAGSTWESTVEAARNQGSVPQVRKRTGKASTVLRDGRTTR